jgi:hypothetical protein
MMYRYLHLRRGIQQNDSPNYAINCSSQLKFKRTYFRVVYSRARQAASCLRYTPQTVLIAIAT